MKSVKSKYPSPTVRTVGQLSCGGKLGLHNMSSGEPVTKRSDYDDPWSKLHRTFSNGQSPRSSSLNGDYAHNEPSPFCSVTKVKDENQTETQGAASTSIKTSDSGVQVNMFHCKDCRRHIKYGKSFKLENSCTESDSENNQLATTNCTHCDRKEGFLNLRAANGNLTEEDEKSENEDLEYQRRARLLDSPRDYSPSRKHSRTPVSDTSPRNEVEELQQSGSGSQDNKFSFTKGGKQFWLSNIKLMTIAIVIIPLILHVTQIFTFNAILSCSPYLRNMVVQEETEEYSVVRWIFELFFGVQGVTKPLPLFLYLF